MRPRAGSALKASSPDLLLAAPEAVGGGAAGAGATDAAATLEKRRSVFLVVPDNDASGSRPTTARGAGPKADLHPGLQKLANFMRRKSLTRSKMSSINDLAEAMESLDSRVMNFLEQMRQSNAAGLGPIRALQKTKSGRLALYRSHNSYKDAIQAYTPRDLLKAAVDDPSVLQRLKFQVEEQQDNDRIAAGRPEGEGGWEEGIAVEQAVAGDGPSPEQQPDGLSRPSSSPDKQALGGPKWGATEGGMDKLGWVRNLVKYNGTGPLAGEAGKPDGVAALEAAGENRASSPPGVPALGPLPPTTRTGRREDVLALQSWLQDMVVQVMGQARPCSAQPGDSLEAAGEGGEAGQDPMSTVAEKPPYELADAALWMYGVAFEELQRQLAIESRDRAELLSAMWTHCYTLVELRCSLSYEEVISGIKQELQSSRHHRQALQTEVKNLEAKVSESMYYDKDRFDDMVAENKRVLQLLAAAEEEGTDSRGEVARLKNALEVESNLRANLESELDATYQLKERLAQKREELEEKVAAQAGIIASHEADMHVLRTDLDATRASERQLLVEKTKLEVDFKRSQRDFQASEILGMSLREQLGARMAELAQVTTEKEDLAARHAAAQAELESTSAALRVLEREHDIVQRTGAEARAELQRSIDKLEESLKDMQLQLAALALEKQASDNAYKESVARENVSSAQLRQLTAAHEQQTSKLQAECEMRGRFEDELQALRSGLQVTQQKLEATGLVFSSNTVHHTVAQAWLATGPISMARQVVATANQQLTDMAARLHTLTHDLGVAKEHWQAEENVRIRLQDQFLEAKAALSKALKDAEAREEVVERLEQQRSTLDNEVTHMRKIVYEAEARSAAAHKKSLEATNEAKRLAPLEDKVAKLEEHLATSKTEIDRLHQDVTTHQESIKRLLDEKEAVMEELSQRNAMLKMVQGEVQALTAGVRDKSQLEVSAQQLQADLQKQLARVAAQEAVLAETMQQLAVARQLLKEFSGGVERERLKAAEGEVLRLQQLAGAKNREVELLQQRLATTEQQLHYTERQLAVMMAHPAAGCCTPDPEEEPVGAGAEAAMQQQEPPPQLGQCQKERQQKQQQQRQQQRERYLQLEPVLEQLRKLLEVKEDRIKQLERLQNSNSTSASEIKALKAEVAARDGIVNKLRRDLEQIRKRLQAAQEQKLKMATRDLISLAQDARLPKELVKEMLHSYVHDHLRSELVWAKAKLAVVSHLSKHLRAKLQAAEVARAQAEMESLCVEAFYLHQAVLDQRATAILFDTTFVNAKHCMSSVAQAVAEVRRMVPPEIENMDRLRKLQQAASAGLNRWMDKFASRVDKGVQLIRPEIEVWKEMVAALPETRALTPPGSASEMGITIVHIYCHALDSTMGPGGLDSRIAHSLFDAMVDFFMHRQGYTHDRASNPGGPVMRLLSGARAHQHRPKLLLLCQLAGVVHSSAGRTLPEGSWPFLLQLLRCIARLNGAAWQTLSKEWAESEEGVGLPLQCVLDVLANTYNTDAPALLDCARRGLLPLVRTGRRGPCLDLDAFLLVLLREFADGNAPVNPLWMPRRLTDGSLAGALSYHSSTPALPTLSSVPSVAAATGLGDPYAGSTAGQKSGPMRKRIINLTGGSPGAGDASLLPSEGVQLPGGRGGSPGSSPGAGVKGLGAAPRSPDIFQGMRDLVATYPQLPMGADSQLRRSAPQNPAKS